MPVTMANPLTIELDREDDGRWIAEIPALPGVMVYAESKEEALRQVEALALRVMADRLESRVSIPAQAAELFHVL